MEARCTYRFDSNEGDELSFSVGDKIKILSFGDETEGWYEAEMNGRKGAVPFNYVDVAPHPWFHQTVKREEATQMLMTKDERADFIHPVGTFIIRQGSGGVGDFSMSVRVASDVHQYKIKRDDSGKFYLWDEKFDSINAMVDYYKTVSVSKNSCVILKEKKEKKAPVKLKGLYKFETTEADELSFDKDDILTLIDDSEPDWWRVQLRGKDGLVPANYVERLK